MNILDFVTQDEIDGLPEEPEYAFVEFVRIAQKKLGKRLSELGDDRDSWHAVNDARHGFTNVTLGVAKRLGVKPFSEMDVPQLDGFEDRAYRQFQRDLDFYMAQLLVGNSYRTRSESVKAYPSVATTIRSSIKGLREAIANANLGKAKRDALNARLDELESELSRKRLRFWLIAAVFVDLLGVPGELWQSGDVVGKLTQEIWSAVAEAKSTEQGDKPSLPYDEPPLALLPPRPSEPERKRGRRDIAGDLDDEIPF